MVKRETINGRVFIAQTTYYVYRSEAELQDDKPPFLETSNGETFEQYKEQERAINPRYCECVGRTIYTHDPKRVANICYKCGGDKPIEVDSIVWNNEPHNYTDILDLGKLGQIKSASPLIWVDIDVSMCLDIETVWGHEIARIGDTISKNNKDELTVIPNETDNR